MKHLLRTQLLLICFLLISQISPAQFYLQETAFKSPLVKSYTASVEQIIVQPDQKILLDPGAGFINGTKVEGLARLNADGSLDTTFRLSTVTEDYHSIALRPDGKILAVNLYTSSTGKTRVCLRVLSASGAIDSTYYTDIDCDYLSRNAFAIQQDGKILIGANVLENGVYKAKVYRLTSLGSSDNTFDTGLLNASWVGEIVVQAGGKTLVFGDFPGSISNVSRKVLRLNPDGSEDTGFAPSLSIALSAKTAVIQPDGKILVTINSAIGSVGQVGIVRLNPDGTQDNTFEAPTSPVSINASALALQPNGQILVPTWYHNTTAGAGRWQVIRLNSNGSIDNAFGSAEGADHYISTMAIQADGKVLAGGMFWNYDGQTRAGLVRIGNDGSADLSFKARLESGSRINLIEKQADGKILVGGTFNTVNDQEHNRLTRLTPAGTVDPAFNTGTGAKNGATTNYADVRAIGVQADGKVLVGGSFTSFNGQNTSGLVRLNSDGSTINVFQISTEAGYTVEAIAVQPDQKVLVGGFVPDDKDPLKTLVRLLPDGSPDPAFSIGTGFKGSVSNVVLQPDGKILAGGRFTHFDNAPVEKLVRLNADGTRDAAFSAAATGIAVEQVVLQADGKIIIEGSYNSIIISPTSSYLASKIARLHPDGRVDESFKPTLGPHDYIEDIIVQPEGQLLLAGSFHSPRRDLMLLNADGSVNESFFAFFFENLPGVTQLVPDGKDLFAVSFSKLFKLSGFSPQTLAFDSIPDKMAGDQPFALSAKASSGLPVTFEVVSGPASVAGNTVTLSGTPGTVIIRASQAGNDDYQPAYAQRSFQVNVALGLETINDLVRVYPNPAPGKFLVEVPAFWQVTDIQLLNVPGKPVGASYTRTAAGYEVRPHVLSPGMYLLHVRSNAGAYVKKIVIR